MPATATRPGVQPRGGAPAAPGLLLCAGVAAVATAVGAIAPVLGAPVSAILLGVGLRFALGERALLAPGVRAAQGVVLPLAVVVLGSQLSLTEIVQVGYGALPVMLGTLAGCLAVAHAAGRRLGIATDLRTLIGVGTAICGASAIAAVSPVIKARSTPIAYALSTIFLFNVAAVVIFPPLGHALGLGQTEFGLFAGTAVNDTSSVVATASAYGSAAADHAVVVKLVRTLMIIPICVGLAVLVRRRETASGGADGHTAGVRPLRLVPWFLVGFVLVAAANSVGLIPAGAHAGLSHVALWLITTALAGVGLSTDLGGLRRTGPRPMLLGLLLWVTVAATSLLLQWATVS